MVNFEKLYKKVALKVIERCHGGIKIKKQGKIIEMYDPANHAWSIIAKNMARPVAIGRKDDFAALPERRL